MTAAGLEDAAVRLFEVLGEDECLLIGGLAVAAHGFLRATAEVDFVVRELDTAARRLRDQGIDTKRSRGHFTCLKGTIRDVAFDILPPLAPIDWTRAITVSLGGDTRIRVVDLDGLIRLKLKAAGPKDLMDIAALVLRHPKKRKTARELAAAHGLLDKLDLWLSDPRLKADLEEVMPRPRRTKAKATKKASPRAGHRR